MSPRLASHGELYDPLLHTPSEDLYEIYHELREHHPVFHNGERGVWCISRYDSVSAAAHDWKTFASGDGVALDVPARFFGEGDFLENDPPKHDQLRALVKHRFSQRRVMRLARVTEQRVATLLRRLRDHEEADLAAELAWELPIWVICHLLGIPDGDYRYVRSRLDPLSTRPGGLAAAAPAGVAALNELQDYLADRADAKRNAPGDDLLTDLIRAVDRGEMARDDLVGVAVLMFFAGSETASCLLANALWLVDSHPDQQRQLRSGQVAIEAAIEEMVRLESPVQYLARSTTRDVTVDDVHIPNGARVVLLYGAANRDERRFPHAERLDLSREAKRHLGFGHGIHFCLGAPLARVEAKIALSRFLSEVEAFEVTEPPARLTSHIFRGIVHLPAHLKFVR